MTEETQARNKMESQLGQMQKLLEMLVGDKQASVSSSVAEVPVSVSSHLNAASVQTPSSGQNSTGGGERSSTSTTFSNIMPISSVSMSRSTSFCSIPKIMEGMSFVDFKQKVMVWRKLISDSIPPEKQGLMLLGELPTKDKFGGLQGMVIDNIGLEILSEHDSVDQLLTFLEKRLMEPSFVRLCRWMDKYENFEQKSTWNAERMITEFNKLNNQAKTEFSLILPPVMKAAKLVRACNDIPEDQVGMLTSSLELGHSDVHEKAETMIRQYI